MNSRVRKVAAVTGASSGIGRAIAVEFARSGYDVIATGRDEIALRDLAAEIATSYQRVAEIVVADLAVGADRERLAEILGSRQIDVLVNNAGSGVRGDFSDTSLDDETRLIDVQIITMLTLTKAVLPRMKARSSGHILNVASVYAFTPVPQQSVYAATKSFIYSFSESLRDELSKDGVSISVLAPGITRTAFRKRAGIPDQPNSGLSPDVVAAAAVSGTLKGRALIIPGLSNRVFVFLAKHLPTKITVSLINLINSRRGVHRSS